MAISIFLNRFAMRVGLLLGVLALTFSAMPLADAQQDTLVSEDPLTNLPRVLDGRIYGIDSVGSTVIVGGTFTTISDTAVGSMNQPSLFKFNSSTGVIDQAFLPQFDGRVEAVDISADGQSVFIGGGFSTVNGVTRRNVVKLSMADGSVVTQFTANAGAVVQDMALATDALYLGGRLGTLNGTSVERFAAVDLTTGDLIPALTVPVSGTRSAVSAGFIQEMDLSPDGRWIVVVGNFTAVGGQPRQQIGIIEITGGSASVSPWATDEYADTCATVFDKTWIRGIDIDPTSSFFVVATTGAHFGADRLCDTAARWELPVTSAGPNSLPTWVNHTGGDTLWSAEITEAAVYFGGHQRWANNPYPSPRGDRDGPGSLVRKGVVALDPLTGVPLSWNPERIRGRGIEALHATSDFLFTGSDTEFWNNRKIERLVVLPVDTTWFNPAPVPVNLPASMYYVSGNSVNRASFDGASFGSPATISGPGVDGISWTPTRASFGVNDDIVTYDTDSAYYRRDFSDGVVGARTNLSTTVGYVDVEAITPFDQPYGIAETTNAAYLDGRVYYTRSDSSQLHWRWYSLESGIMGGIQYVASSGRNWSDTTGLTIIGGDLFAATTGNQLLRYSVNGTSVASSGTLIDSGGSGINWASVSDLFAGAPAGAVTPPTTSVTDPGDGAVLPGGTVNLAGTAGDNSSVAAVNVVVQDTISGLYLQANGSFGAAPADLAATLDSPGASSTGWSLAINVPSGNYQATATAVDGGGTPDPSGAVVGFVVDDENPATTVDAPAEGSTVTVANVDFSGSATDNVGVERERIALADLDSGLFLQSNGSFGATRVFFEATLDAPGAATTNWSWSATLPDGRYRIIAKADDTVGNVESAVRTTFTVDTSIVNPTLPSSTITSSAALPAGLNTLMGAASDDTGVATVRLVIRNRDNSLYVQDDGTLAANWNAMDATLTNPGGAATDWSLDVLLSDPGRYRIVVKAIDVDANTQDPSTVQNAVVS